MVKVIYQDNYLLVMDKPPGLVVTSSETQKEETLEDILKSQFSLNLERGGIVHRLDKDTSGVMLVAKTLTALENLQNQFKERLIKKEYLALVHGWVAESGRVDAVIGRNPKNREKFTVLLGFTSKESKPPGESFRLPSALRARPFEVFTGGREAVTEYEPLERLQFTGNRLQEIFSNFNKIQMRKLYTVQYNLFTLLRCKPKTGRTHQIRVHLKYINHAIVADEKYGGRKMVRLDKRWCPRMFLHAARIGFRHPVSGEWMELESELPEDLEKAFQQLSS